MISNYIHIYARAKARNFVFAIILMSLGFCTIANGQKTNTYELGKTNYEFGITGGALFIFATNLELSLNVTERMSETTTIEVRPMIGMINQLYLFEGNDGGYRIGYFGGTLGLLFGKQDKLFELSLGTAYMINPEDGWGSSNNIHPALNIGYIKIYEHRAIRLGVGWPNGIYFSVLF